MKKNILPITLAVSLSALTLPASAALRCPDIRVSDFQRPNYISTTVGIGTPIPYTQKWDSAPFSLKGDIHDIKEIVKDKTYASFLSCKYKLKMDNGTVTPIEMRMWQVQDIGPSRELLNQKIRGIYEKIKYNKGSATLTDDRTGITWYFTNPSHTKLPPTANIAHYANIFRADPDGKRYALFSNSLHMIFNGQKFSLRMAGDFKSY